jgi:hypothetical protein
MRGRLVLLVAATLVGTAVGAPAVGAQSGPCSPQGGFDAVRCAMCLLDPPPQGCAGFWPLPGTGIP